MAVIALGYLGVRSDRLDDWSDFAGRLIGMQKIDHGGRALAFRMDDRAQRLFVLDEPGDTIACIGFEVATRSDLADYAARLDRAGVKAAPGSRDLADRRFVDDLIAFSDPDGNRIELFCGPMLSPDPFVPGRPIEGFKTGPLGMGHVVLHVRDANALMPFYRDLLDFRISDYGLTPYPLYFFHVNGRHHSFAMVGSGKAGFHHLMVEFQNLDDVGQGYDLAQLEEGRIAYTLGRHLNDYVTSYYAYTPSSFFVESGWGGRVIDPASWTPHETFDGPSSWGHETFDGPSSWGHERFYLSEALRKELRDMRLAAAASGRRVPPVAACPWLYGELAKGR
jgi:2,3-dihydroxybiphenyl 1,2-dioxygenase